MTEASLDIVIPVYQEGRNINAVLDHLGSCVKTPFRILIGYDRDDDDTLDALRQRPAGGFEILTVKNESKGVCGAIVTCFAHSRAQAVLVFPADDICNGPIINEMFRRFEEGSEIVAASRFMRGGCMKGCPWLKAVLVRSAAFALYHVARIPTHDSTNGFRLFSRRILETVPVESAQGFAFSIELLVKAHRLGWRISEVPSRWIERSIGRSRFHVLKWLPLYLKWFRYAFATTYLRRRLMKGVT